MVNSLICGSGSSRHQPQEGDEPCNPCLTTRKNPTKSSIPRIKDYKNPYSRSGRDKFSALLSKLEDKRQKIYSKIGSEDISYVRFVYTNSNKCKPVVVKVRNEEQGKYTLDSDKDEDRGHNSEALNKFPQELGDDKDKARGHNSEEFPTESGDRKTKKNSYSWKKRIEMLRTYCLPTVIIFILLVLAVFKLSFAILCTCLVWYLVSTTQGQSSNSKRRRKKKEYARKESEKKNVSD